jgi:hypothetical protein
MEIAYVKASSRNSRSNQDWGLAGTEGTQSILTLTLSTIRVDGSAWHIELEEIVIYLIGGTL